MRSMHKAPICPIYQADGPLKFPPRVYWSVFKRTLSEIRSDNVAIIAAGVAFFTMLAIFPLITACLSIYGLFADPAAVQQPIAALAPLLPPEGWRLLDAQIRTVANAPPLRLQLGIAAGLLFAVWSAGAGIRAVMLAMNIAYGERETRNPAAFFALAGAMTLSVTLFMWLALTVIFGVPALLSLLKLEGLSAIVTYYMPWIIIVLLFGFATFVLYRIGPSRRQAKFRWLFPGVFFATISWLFISAGFSYFVAEFSNFNRFYGSLSAVIILLLWFWLTAFVVIVGAELNAELERHTSVDTTRGRRRPLGKRGAAMADYFHPDSPINIEEQMAPATDDEIAKGD
ncbi:YihY/virulence factor BrkB family protein [Robiginitomaculum antarcticum]|uniref:YihY/virulence factor BrkB family protein n=1 Tax=Robiginitomaculum antarcticum TaxID=437507 RepID=UPI000686DC58|nr:YihY/virulence factor BrkB family protein [Robiginitomaculum antarcticum]